MRFSLMIGMVALVAVGCGGGAFDPMSREAAVVVPQGGGSGNEAFAQPGIASVIRAIPFRNYPYDVGEQGPVSAAGFAEAGPAVLSPVPWAAGPAPYSSAAATFPGIDARGVLVMDEASGAVLFERNGYEALPPASLTKIMTALVALEYGNLDDVVDIDVDAREMEGSSRMGLLPGDQFTLRDLLFGLMLPSGNDAALAIGRHISGSDEAFVDAMNVYAERLRLDSAHFANPHGLSARRHLISAYDLAVLSRFAMNQERFVEFATTRYWVAEGSRTIPMGNLNGFLGDYPGADGIKVGFTNRAGKTLVASATRDGHRVFVVLLNAPTSRDDARKVMDWAFSQHEWPAS